MPYTNYGRQAAIWNIGSNLSDVFISAIAIGSGSGTATDADVTLLNEVSRTIITGSPDFTEVRKVAFQADYNSVQMSGIHLTEFGLFQSGTQGVGSTWMRESFGSIVFDGTNELQIFATVDAPAA
jgi:hypothetical protein